MKREGSLINCLAVFQSYATPCSKHTAWKTILSPSLGLEYDLISDISLGVSALRASVIYWSKQRISSVSADSSSILLIVLVSFYSFSIWFNYELIRLET